MLDKSKKYGEVCGGGAIRFEQDGHLYDVHGNEVDIDGVIIATGKQAENTRHAEKQESNAKVQRATKKKAELAAAAATSPVAKAKAESANAQKAESELPAE